MNGRERMEKVLYGGIPDKVPHFELVFQMPELAFNMSWPTKEEMDKASPKEREQCLERYFDIWNRIIETYKWDAIQLPISLHGYFKNKIISEGQRRFGDKVMIYDFNGDGTFWMLPGSEMMDFTIKLFEAPEELHEEARRKRDASIELAKRQVEQGVDFICINSDYGYNQGPFISPKMFSEFITPYLAEVVDGIHNLGVKAILHSDGDLRQILDQLVSTGLDGYQSIDPQGHMDIAKVKQDYGYKLMLMGNVQASLLQEVDEEKIRQSVRYCMTYGKPGGKYIFSTSNCVFNGMPLESYHIMLDEYNKMARY
jgi:uroporphyrinogen decarboxylase